MRFKDRVEAGRLLAEELSAYRGREDAIIFALPRGGVVVGYEVAVALRAPLDVVAVRKVGLPECPEVALGALASGGLESISRRSVEQFRVSPEVLRNVVAKERRELVRQERLFRNDRPFPDLHGKAALLVDDGLATGHTMMAAMAAVRRHAPRELVVAVPVGAAETCRFLAARANRVVCLFAPIDFMAVGAYYDDFRPVSDETVKILLEKANAMDGAGSISG